MQLREGLERCYQVDSNRKTADPLRLRNQKNSILSVWISESLMKQTRSFLNQLGLIGNLKELEVDTYCVVEDLVAEGELNGWRKVEMQTREVTELMAGFQHRLLIGSLSRGTWLSLGDCQGRASLIPCYVESQNRQLRFQ